MKLAGRELIATPLNDPPGTAAVRLAVKLGGFPVASLECTAYEARLLAAELLQAADAAEGGAL
jgi:hypothetical protein